MSLLGERETLLLGPFKVHGMNGKKRSSARDLNNRRESKINHFSTRIRNTQPFPARGEPPWSSVLKKVAFSAQGSFSFHDQDLKATVEGKDSTPLRVIYYAY